MLLMLDCRIFVFRGMLRRSAHLHPSMKQLLVGCGTVLILMHFVLNY